jgi:putative ABC transport system ATP-binding protein
MESIIVLRDVVKEYVMGEVSVRAVDGVSFEISEGEFVVVLGPSGSGKSTVLNMIGGMDCPTSGEIRVAGRDITKLSSREMTLYRRDYIGFVFQFYNLMPNLTALENVELTAQISGEPLNVKETINSVGLGGRMMNFPAQLSGGEQQRIAIARAVVKNPPILLCDEPTGALDFKTGLSILGVLNHINKTMKKTVIVITHNAAIAGMADRVIRLKSGAVELIVKNDTVLPPERIEW